MNRNSQSHFALTPSIDLNKLGQEGKRSKFNINYKVKTTFNVGDVIVLDFKDVIPGDTFSTTEKKAIRMATPLYPVMDDLVFDTYSFFVPYRLVFDKFKEFMGENTTTKWEQEVEYEIPQLTAPEGGWNVGTIADYFGIPTGISGISVSALPFRAYALIMNNYFRDQNLSDPCMNYFDETTRQGSNGAIYQTDVVLGGMPFKAAKTHDYFTSALPDTQKGPDVLIPLGESAPVIGNGENWITFTDGTKETGIEPTTVGGINGTIMGAANSDRTLGVQGNSFIGTTNKLLGLTEDPTKSGMIADLSTARGANIVELRQATAIQRILERDAVGGTRYHEVVKAHFGVTTPDAIVQIPEYLGGERILINMDQVLQTSSTDTTSPQGNTAAYSLSVGSSNIYRKAFDEHGMIITVGVARVLTRSYQQGINRYWSKRKRLDFYWPELANIGMQEILNKEIRAQGTDEDNEVFGYQERYAEYKYQPNLITGYMRSSAPESLDAWHYGDDFSTLPVLGDEFIREPVAPVDRTIAVSSENAHQFFGEFEYITEAVRTMPLFSNPSLQSYL